MVSQHKARGAIRLLGVALAAGVFLASCSATPELVSSPSGDTLPPALDTQRLQKLIADTDKLSKAADEAQDISQAAARFSGPATAMRNGEFIQTKVTAGATVSALPLANPQALVVGQAGDYPHYAFSVSPVQSGQGIYVFSYAQSQARANYALWGWVRLFPKVKFPATYKPEVASPQVLPTSAEFVMEPRQVAQNYAHLLNDPNHTAKTQFDIQLDAFMQTYKQRREQYAQLAQSNQGLEFNLLASPGTDGMVALGTTDAGALVMTTIKYNLEMKSDRKLQASALAKALTGKDTAASTLQETHTVTALFLLPSKGSKQKVALLGATDVVTAMSAD